MQQVLSGFAVVWVIIAVGFLVGRTGVLGEDARTVLSRTAFFVGNPALLFVTLSRADVAAVLGPQLWVAAISALAAAGVYLAVTVPLLQGRPPSERVMAALSSSLVNSANLGIPIATYVLGDAALAAPALIFQLAVYTPLYVAAMDATTAREAEERATGRRAVRRSPGRAALAQLGQTARNPMVVGAMLGLLFSVTGWALPGPLMQSVELIGGLSIPAMLLAFGMSLVGSRPLARAGGRRADVLIASAVKLLVHPLLAWVLAQFVFGLDARHVFVAVVLASLPTAQNVYVSAVRYDAGLRVSKDTILVTTVVAIPAMIGVALVLA
ncbi:AEC family transporter [Micrococcus sp. EYE_162]|uniref:AEC family transporter n=1 Tax=unclassified Micrococcus TaxID=2620948 RepID=UPI0020045D61|nr:AEC family transporter [Micrococcus sp. EYE_212]MCK6171399.1 AEC family transporter [Micrococcus sp. EYE_162]